MNSTQFVPNTHQFLISFPDWVYAILSIGVIAAVFFLGGLYCKVNEICNDYPKIRQALTRISEILLQKKLSGDLVYTQSPVQLTPKGVQALQEAGFENFYEKNKDILFRKIKESNPKTLADLEEVCKSIMLSVNDRYNEFESLKQYAYSHGEPISSILFAASIALRDKMKVVLNINA